MLQAHVSDVTENQPTPRTLKELMPQLLLQPSQRTRQCRLIQVELTGGSRDSSEPRNGLKLAQLIKVHDAPYALKTYFFPILAFHNPLFQGQTRCQTA